MPTDDRKRRILDHLSQSAKGASYVPKTSSSSSSSSPVTPSAPVNPEPITPPTPTPKPTFTPSIPPSVSAQNRKRRIMDHLSLSSKEFGDITSTSDEEKRKRQIQEHIKKSQG